MGAWHSRSRKQCQLGMQGVHLNPSNKGCPFLSSITWAAAKPYWDNLLIGQWAYYKVWMQSLTGSGRWLIWEQLICPANLICWLGSDIGGCAHAKSLLTFRKPIWADERGIQVVSREWEREIEKWTRNPCWPQCPFFFFFFIRGVMDRPYTFWFSARLHVGKSLGCGPRMQRTVSGIYTSVIMQRAHLALIPSFQQS